MHKLNMQCDIYNTNKEGIFIFVKQGMLPSNILPPSLIAELGTLTLFKSKNIVENSPLMGANPRDIISRITEHGYAIQKTEVKTTISEVGAGIGAGILAASLGAALPITVAISAAGYIAAHLLKEQEEEEENND